MNHPFVNYAALVRKLRDGKPFGLLSQQSSPLGGMLHEQCRQAFKSVFSAEHGYFGLAGPGEKTASSRHPRWRLPVHSLYGETRKPTPEMLKGIERIVVDLQDIGVRCYTYLASLKLVMEAAAENGVEVVVLDRPVPLGGVVDGPVTADGHSSFVAPARLPLCHGMTIGEEAEFLAAESGDSRMKPDVVKMKGWNHGNRAPWPDFLPPSPGIKSWDSAVIYPLTVFSEAYPALDVDRSGNLAFRVLGAKWMDAEKLMRDTRDELAKCGIAMREYRWGEISGVLFSVAAPGRYRPVRASMALLKAIERRWGKQLAEGTRPEWMDKLMGGKSRTPESWRSGLAGYSRKRVNLYR